MRSHLLRSGILFVIALAGGLCSGCVHHTVTPAVSPASQTVVVPSASLTPFQHAVVAELERQTAANIRYDGSYFRGGVPPANVGACSDVALRAFQAAGVDLKRAVTDDIQAHQRLYPLAHPDPNIDHRRCRNLVVYFQRHTKELPISQEKAHWQPGDVVFWGTDGKNTLYHIGLVGNHIGPSGNPTVVQHSPGGVVDESDTLYHLPVLHHFRWSVK